jgi:ATP synthase protein I
MSELPQPAPEGENTTQSMGKGMNVGINLMSSVVVGGAMGYGLDYVFGTLPLFMLVFCFLGFGAGLRGIWKVIQNKPSVPQ